MYLEEKCGFIPLVNALLIPIYEPTEKVLPFLKEFQKEDFDHFLVVDDGSGESYRPIFDSIAAETVFPVHSYPGNKGKGHALKEGIALLLKQYPELDTIVTADGDGQHLRKDILRVSSKAKEFDFVKACIDKKDRSIPAYLSADDDKMTYKYVRYPALGEVPYPFNAEFNLVVEFYSR